MEIYGAGHSTLIKKENAIEKTHTKNINIFILIAARKKRGIESISISSLKVS